MKNGVSLSCLSRILLSITQESGNVCLKFEDWFHSDSKLIIKEAEIVEQEAPIYRYRRNLYASPCSMVEQVELHQNGEKYEFHFLMKNVTHEGKEIFWYLTIRGKDMQEENKVYKSIKESADVQ